MKKLIVTMMFAALAIPALAQEKAAAPAKKADEKKTMAAEKKAAPATEKKATKGKKKAAAKGEAKADTAKKPEAKKPM